MKWVLQGTVADRILFMDEGLIMESGSPEEVFENPQNERCKEYPEQGIIEILKTEG